MAPDLFAGQEATSWPETIDCQHCDANTTGVEAARAAGWHAVGPDDGPGWNYLGTCPDCRESCCCPVCLARLPCVEEA